MTTIAWDGKTLAIDSMVTSGSTVVSIDQQKLFLDVGRFKAVAVSGCIVNLLAVIDWIEAGEQGDPPKTDDGDSAICIDEDGQCHTYWYGSSKCPQIDKGMSANGNGWEIAIGAMEAGASAVEAVEIACKRNVYTGGKIQSYTHV